MEYRREIIPDYYADEWLKKIGDQGFKAIHVEKDGSKYEILFMKEDNQSDSKHEIDWEKRRYEIAKEMLPTIQSINSQVCFRCGKLSSDKEVVENAILFADELIKQLKGE